MKKLVRNTLIGAAGVVVLALVSAFVIISLLLVRLHHAAERAGNEAATIQNLKTISAVEAQYFSTHNRTFATLDQLVRERMLSSKFAVNPPVADGYVLTLSLSPKPPGPGSSYTLTANPVDNSTGHNHFYLDSSSNEIHANADKQAGPGDPW